MSFDNDETLSYYYAERKHYMIRIYTFVIFAKFGHISELVSGLTYTPESFRDDTLIKNLYPSTDEGDAAFQLALIFATI